MDQQTSINLNSHDITQSENKSETKPTEDASCQDVKPTIERIVKDKYFDRNLLACMGHEYFDDLYAIDKVNKQKGLLTKEVSIIYDLDDVTDKYDEPNGTYREMISNVLTAKSEHATLP
jgi:hypothetical protein